MKFKIPNVQALSHLNPPELADTLAHAMDNKTKPVGSLGELEALAVQVGCVLGSLHPDLVAPQLVVFAADHGLAAQGVSAYPSDVTWQMVQNFLAGGAAVSVLAQQHGLDLTVVDCGVRHDFQPRSGLLVRKIAYGTADSSQAPAMTAEQCDTALTQGADVVRHLHGNTLLLGEMGIGNTSAASLLMARLLQIDIAHCTGAGTGLDDVAIARKTQILRSVLERHADAVTPLSALAALGGFEMATMVGAVLQAAHERRLIVVDGFITTAVVLVASQLRPAVLERCVFAHQSHERAHRDLLAHLGARALLNLNLRLGEGSGAALAWPLVQSACRLLNGMASFEAAGVSRQSEELQS